MKAITLFQERRRPLRFGGDEAGTIVRAEGAHKAKQSTAPPWWGVTLLTLLGAWLRFRGLAADEFWYDEAFSALLVRRNWGEMLVLITQDVHPPLYYLGLKLWSGVFGYSDFALRSFSAVLGVLLILLVYRLAIQLFEDETTALIIAFVFAVNPFFIEYSQETRAYALLAVLIVGITSALYSKRWLLLSILVSLALMTHYIAVFFIPSIVLIIVGYNIYAKKVILPSVHSLILPLVVFSLWFPVLRGQWETKDTLMGWVEKTNLTSFLNTAQELLFGIDISEFRVILVVPIMVLVGVYTFVTVTRRARLSMLYLLVMSSLPIFGVTIASRYLNIYLYINRVLIGFLAVFLIYLAFTVSVFNKKIALSILVVYAGLTLFLHKEVKNPGYRQLAQYAADSPRTLVMADPMMYGTLQHYLSAAATNKVKLQEDQLGYWPLISSENIIIKNEMKEPFYFVNRGEIPTWSYFEKISEFYLYEWEPSSF